MIDISVIRNINEGNVRCLSIDPGSNNMGYSIVELNVKTWTISILRCETVKAKDIVSELSDLNEILGERFVRNIAYKEFIKNLLLKWHIDFVVCEAAYAGAFIKAYQSLTEHVTLLKAAVYLYDRQMTFLMVEPSVVKKAMGVKGNSGDKSLMTKALSERNSIVICDTIVIAQLDEHSIDAACIGLTTLDKIRGNMRASLNE